MHKINPFRIQQQHVSNAQRLAALGRRDLDHRDGRAHRAADGRDTSCSSRRWRTATPCASAWTSPTARRSSIWGFTDKYSWVPSVFSGFGDALIYDANYQPKPAYTALQSVLEEGSPQPPAAPTGLTALAGNGQVALSWSASSGATSYNVKRSTTSGGPYATVASATGTSFTNTGLTNGTTYFFVVSAVNGAGESPNSNQVPRHAAARRASRSRPTRPA